MMAHLSKLERVESASNSRDSDLQEDLDPGRRPTPHDELWFEDGSIVLQTDLHLYRVHNSMLAKYSSVFKDMFEMPNGGDGGRVSGGVDEDTYDGLPLVRMAGDSDDDVFHFLMTIYNREYVDNTS